MKKIILLALLITTPAFAQEQLDLTTSIPAEAPQVDAYKVARIILDRLNKSIEIQVWDGLNRSTLKPFNLNDQDHNAFTLMKQLNNGTIDLSTQSLEKRILNKLVSEGFLSGTISGTPDA